MVIITGSAIQFSADNQQTAIYPAIGTILLWGGDVNITSLSPDYLICDGSELLKQGQYNPLYLIVGDKYGPAPSGANYFNLPNLEERIPIGANDAAAVSYTSPTSIYTSPYFGGTNKLDNNRYYPHTHSFNVVHYTVTVGTQEVERFGVNADRFGMDDHFDTNTNSGFISKIGDGLPTSSENYYPPYTLVNYIIKAKTTLYTS
jgi:microcystin-dependent protein